MEFEMNISFIFKKNIYLLKTKNIINSMIKVVFFSHGSQDH